MNNSANYSDSEMSKRVRLAEIVPLDKPFTVNICVSNICNLKCEYCTFTDQKIRKEKISLGTKGLMDFELFKQIVDNIKSSFGTLKQLVLTGAGEPLLNPYISEMVKYVKEIRLTDRVELLTNGVALTEKKGKDLVDSGLTYLRISLNGLSSEDFQKYTGVKINFDDYVDRISRLYECRGETKIYIKIMNYMVSTEERRNQFFDIFSPICDIINIENLHAYGGDTVKYDEFVDPSILQKPKYYNTKSFAEICPMPYYFTIIDIDGSVYPCCEGIARNQDYSFGKATEESFKSIWYNISDFQKDMLNGIKSMSYCKKCSSAYAFIRFEDILDDNVEEIKQRYEDVLRKE